MSRHFADVCLVGNTMSSAIQKSVNFDNFVELYLRWRKKYHFKALLSGVDEFFQTEVYVKS